MLQKSDYQRYSQIYSPMDESLILIVSDISNRPFLSYYINFDMPQIANFPLELIEEFILALVNNAKITMHIKMIDGKNNHHKAEAIFKGIGRALAIHFKQSLQGVQSTKGMLI
jgi:imidazoleglycerol-phosphate dehydratase